MELTTPTGAAILANLAGTVTRFPAMTPLRMGRRTSSEPGVRPSISLLTAKP